MEVIEPGENHSSAGGLDTRVLIVGDDRVEAGAAQSPAGGKNQDAH